MPNRYDLLQASHRQLLDYKPNVALLPWGATEAHNYHLPYATDIIEAHEIALHSAALAHEQGGRPVVLPPVPFGNNAQQLDQQVATISICTATAAAILRDVTRSLCAQGIDRLLIINAHGGNEFKPLVRDIQAEIGLLMVVINFWQMISDERDAIFYEVGAHAGEMETALLMHLCPHNVQLDQAGEGSTNEYVIKTLSRPGVWFPRPWSKVHPDTGCGNPKAAMADKGKAYFEKVCQALADVLVELSQARKGDLLYV